jgi:hypothetical protein
MVKMIGDEHLSSLRHLRSDIEYQHQRQSIRDNDYNNMISTIDHQTKIWLQDWYRKLVKFII